MYSVNGVPLDNPTLGWIFRGPSKPLSEISRDRSSLRIPSVDGVIAGVPSTYDPVVLSFVVQTPRANLETLYAVFSRDGGYVNLTASPGKRAAFELLSSSLDGYGDADAVIDVTFVLRLPGAFWRDAAETTSPSASVSGGTVQVDGLWPGMSAPVQDCVIRIKGYTAAPISVTDSGGSWFKFDGRELFSGQYLLFAAAAGTAVLSTFATSWDDYDEDVSGLVDFGGPRGVFEITPFWDTDPSVRAGRVVLTTGTLGGPLPGFSPSIEIRGRGAYLV